MLIFTNASEKKRVMFEGASGIKFKPLAEAKKENDAACLLLRDEEDMLFLKAVGAGIPVVVVAGTKDPEGEAIIEEATSAGIPEECICIKSGNEVVSLTGEIIGKAVRGGISLRTAIEFAQKAIKENLMPEILVWEDKAEEIVIATTKAKWADSEPSEPKIENKQEIKTETPKQDVDRLISLPLEQYLQMAKKNIACIVFSKNAEMQVFALCKSANAVMVEFADPPVMYARLGDKPDEVVKKEKYMYLSSKQIVAPQSFTGVQTVVNVMNPITVDPEVLDEVYRASDKVVIVADAGSEKTLESWVASGYKLDGVLASNMADIPVLKKHHSAVYIDPNPLLKSLGAGGA